MRLAVIGAGLSGLTAGFYLHRSIPDAKLEIFEASQRVGGVIETENRDGWIVEHGADCFSVNPPDALKLCQDLGVDHELIEPNLVGRGAMISRGNQLYAVPEGFVLMWPTRLWQVLKSPLLSWPGKIRLACERFVRQRDDLGDESLASFTRRRLGKETLDRIVQPLVGGIYTADAERLSMQATMPQFVKMEREFGGLLAANRKESMQSISLERESSGARYGQFRVFPEGMTRLFEEILKQLPDDSLKLGTAVRNIQRQHDNKWLLSTDEQIDIPFDGVIVALPSSITSSLLRPICSSAADLLEKIEYASSAIVLLGIRTSSIDKLPNAFGFVCPIADQRPILAASFASHKFPGRTPQGYTLIRIFIGGAVQPKMLDHDDQELTSIAISEMHTLIGLRGEPEWTAVQRWNKAMPQYHVGHKSLVAEIEKHVQSIPMLEICGNGLLGVGVAPVVGSARRAAERLAANLNKVDRTATD